MRFKHGYITGMPGLYFSVSLGNSETIGDIDRETIRSCFCENSLSFLMMTFPINPMVADFPIMSYLKKHTLYTCCVTSNDLLKST